MFHESINQFIICFVENDEYRKTNAISPLITKYCSKFQGVSMFLLMELIEYFSRLSLQTDF